jgi:hypothetical protein
MAEKTIAKTKQRTCVKEKKTVRMIGKEKLCADETAHIAISSPYYD